MSYLNILLFYTVFSPFIFIYGIGFERLCIISNNTISHFHFYAKNFIFVFIASSFSYVFFNFVAYPLHITFFFPFMLMTFLFFLEKGVDYLYEGFVYGEKPIAHNERVFTFGTVIFSLYEATSYFELFIIVLLSFILLFILSTLLRSIRRKMDAFNIENKLKNVPLLLITLAGIATAFYFMDAFYK